MMLGGGKVVLPTASWAQVGEVATANGKKLPADPEFAQTDKTVNLIVDDFKRFVFTDPVNGNVLKYNLYIPKNYDKTKSYPMVLFMPDATGTSSDYLRTLTLGVGGVIWASPESQAKHPAFVLAPVFETQVTTDDFKMSSWVDTVYHLIKQLPTEYSIDTNRLYTTGQSGGCMTSLALDVKYPDLFAASMLVAGQWDPQATAVMHDKKAWIVVAEGDTKAFPGMNASIAVWEKLGTKVSRATWSAQLPMAEQDANAAKQAAEGRSINYTTFIKGTTFAPGQTDGMEHMNTWRYAYYITPIRDWIFSQSKAATK